MYRLSEHARVRARQRGVLDAHIDAVVRHADRSRNGRDGVEMLWISEQLLTTFGARTPEGVDTDRLKNFYVLMGTSGCVVTNYRRQRLRRPRFSS